MQNLLELKGISRRVSDRFSLRVVTLAVEPGQIVGFVGANGAGKTTTIRAALGLIKLDAGEVHLLGQRCDANAPDETHSATCAPASGLSWTRVPSPPRSRWARSRGS